MELLERNIPVINSKQKYWIVRSGVESKYFEDFAISSYIALGWDRISNIEAIKKLESIENLKDLIRSRYPEFEDENNEKKSSKRKVSDIASKIHKFINELNIGDVIVTPGKEDVLIGEIIGDTYLIENNSIDVKTSFDEEMIGNLNKARKVKWLKRIARKDLEPDLKMMLGVYHGISNINNEQAITEINRTLYNFYIRDDRGHLIYKVNTQTEIDFEKYANFINKMNSVFSILKENLDDKLFIKTNIQSPGPIEFIGKPTMALFLNLCARYIFKNDEKALEYVRIPSEKLEEVKKLKEEEDNYKDYDFPTHETY